MDKRTFVGLCAALAFAAGSPGAHALKIFGTKPADQAAVKDATANDSFTYAAETLLMGTGYVTKASDDSDTATYYNIGEDVYLAAPVGIAADMGDIYVVTVVLNGMVFRDKVKENNLSDGKFSVASGGGAGDKLAVFRLNNTQTIKTTAFLSLQAKFAISGNAGTVTLTIKNQTLAGLGISGVTGTEEHTGTVIKVAPALDEDAEAMNATADVAASFKKFLVESRNETVVSVGSLQVRFESHLVATGSEAGKKIDSLSSIVGTGNDSDGDPESTVTFMGDFSFAKAVFLGKDDKCDVKMAERTQLLMLDAEGMVSDTTMSKAVSVDKLSAAKRRPLCIEVQGEDDESEGGMDAPRIPATGAYTAMGSYKEIENAAIGPKPQKQTLGMIARNGTTVHIPYMTTWEGYNQRIVLSNRGSADAPYEMTFRPEEDVMATGTDMAMGTLMGNTTVTYSAADLVTLTGGSRTAATIILEAQPRYIDVTSVTVNKTSRDSDTVVHHSDSRAE